MIVLTKKFIKQFRMTDVEADETFCGSCYRASVLRDGEPYAKAYQSPEFYDLEFRLLDRPSNSEDLISKHADLRRDILEALSDEGRNYFTNVLAPSFILGTTMGQLCQFEVLLRNLSEGDGLRRHVFAAGSYNKGELRMTMETSDAPDDFTVPEGLTLIGVWDKDELGLR